jgi:hypothetical protein
MEDVIKHSASIVKIKELIISTMRKDYSNNDDIENIIEMIDNIGKKNKKIKKTTTEKKPPTKFNLFLIKQKPELAKTNPTASKSEIHQMATQLWKDTKDTVVKVDDDKDDKDDKTDDKDDKTDDEDDEVEKKKPKQKSTKKKK